MYFWLPASGHHDAFAIAITTTFQQILEPTASKHFEISHYPDFQNKNR